MLALIIISQILAFVLVSGQLRKWANTSQLSHDSKTGKIVRLPSPHRTDSNLGCQHDTVGLYSLFQEIQVEVDDTDLHPEDPVSTLSCSDCSAQAI